MSDADHISEGVATQSAAPGQSTPADISAASHAGAGAPAVGDFERGSSPRPLTTARPVLAPYQRRFVADASRFRAIVKARRCGGSYAAAYSAALRMCGLRASLTSAALEREAGGGVPQRIVSHSEDGSIRLLAEVHGIATKLAAAGLLERGVTVGVLSSTSFALSNGIEATAHAGDGRAVRGLAGDVTLDEFAYSRDPAKLWQAVKSVSDPTLANPVGYRLTVVTTPFIADSLPHEVCCGTGADDDRFAHISRYSWPLSRVTRQGFPYAFATEDEREKYCAGIREEFGDEAAFEVEYEGVWLNPSEMFLERELLERTRYDAADLPMQLTTEYAGVDVARKGKHLTAIARVRTVTTRDGSGASRVSMWALPVETLRGVAFAQQHEAFARVIDGGCSMLAIDATGLGMAVGEALATAFPGKVKQVVFTAAIKEELASTLRLALEEGRLRLPHSPELLRDLASLRRIAQPGGGFRYDASDRGGSHADRAWALALAVHLAASNASASFGGESDRTNISFGDTIAALL